MTGTRHYYRLCATPGCTANLGKHGNDKCYMCRGKDARRPAVIEPSTEAPDWTDAVCRRTDLLPRTLQSIGPEVWFHVDTEHIAKGLCHVCPVREECQSFAVNSTPIITDGVWGGLNPRELKNARKYAQRQARRA